MSPVPAPAPVTPGGGHPSTLYDATADTPSLIADDGAVTVQDNIDFVSHGKLDLNAGFNPGDGEGRLPTWFDPANNVWNEGGWFAFGYTATKVAMHFGYEDSPGIAFYVQDNAVYVQFGGGNDTWDFSEFVIYGSPTAGNTNHIDMWASDAFGGYFALYAHGHGTPAFHFQTAGSAGSDGDTKLGFFGVNLAGQAAHIAHATDNPSAITRLNSLIDAVQNYGLLAAA